MAMATRNELALKVSPLQNGRDVNDEECVQIMWDAVRNTYSTDMRALTFKQMNYADFYKWADALKDYVRTPIQNIIIIINSSYIESKHAVNTLLLSDKLT